MCLRRFRVKDDSMLPSFREGDYVLVRPFLRLRAGDVVVARAPPGFVLKRVSKLSPEGCWLRGDNRARSRDVGPLPRKAIVGKVWLHVER
ncbi:MAG: S26 family signal peptidase [Candidatus Aenigmarchaeota archaeon]|nr:S26 family signal peptidase [Candidatus Aenigmarchaeota archaeon]